MAKTYKTKSPAKINIGLRVLSVRNDGFHDIETIFYPVRLFDTISLKIREIESSTNTVTVKTSGTKQISRKENICYKAALYYLEVFRSESHYRIDINIKKVIPIGAGLGGGSSDAASVLKILEKHFRKGKQTPTAGIRHNVKLRKLAVSLGSDVPFFLLNKPAYASGRGERLKLLPYFKISGKILIVNPGINVSTSWAYRALKVKTRRAARLSGVKKFSPEDIRLMTNDFERVIFKEYPAIERIKYEMITYGAKFALMSGSGSTVYGIFAPAKIKEAERHFRNRKYNVFSV